MKVLAVFLLAICAINSVRANNAEECEEQAETCVEGLLGALVEDSTQEEVCREMRTTITCIRKVVEDCLEGEDEEVEEGLQRLEGLLRENCDDNSDNDEDHDEDMEKCVTENEDYLEECILVGIQEALSTLADKAEMDENVLTCAMYGMVASCFEERVGEKCGAKAAKIAHDEFADPPEEIKTACEAAGGVETHAFNLLDKKRRK